MNLDSTKVPQLNSANNFVGNQAVSGNVTATGVVSASAFSGNGSGLSGVGTIMAVTAGTDLIGGGGSGTVTMALDTTKVPQLAASNSFTGNQSITGNLSASGPVTVGGAVLPATGTATAGAGFTSQPLDAIASAFNTNTNAAVNQDFRWETEPTGNNTTSPSGKLNLLFGSGGTTPAETGLSIASNGQITFASGQTFPGAGGGTITGVTAGTDLTGGGTSGSVTLNLDTTKVAQLNGSNTFTGNETVAGSLSATAGGSATGLSGTSATGDGVVGASSGGAGAAGVYGYDSTAEGMGVSGLSSNGYGVYGLSFTSSGVVGQSSAGNGATGVYGYNNAAGGLGVYGNSLNGTGVYGLSSAQCCVGVYGQNDSGGGAVGVQGESASGYAVYGHSNSGIGVWGGSTSSDGVVGYTNGNGLAAVYGENDGGSTAMGVSGESASGNGVYGSSNGGTGVYGTSSTGDAVYGTSSTGNGVSGESTNAYGVYGYSASNYAGYFYGDLNATGTIYGGGADLSGVINVNPGDNPVMVTGNGSDAQYGGFPNATLTVTNNTTDNYSFVFSASAPNNGGAYCAVETSGNFECSGSTSKTGGAVGTAVQVDDGRLLALSAVHSPEDWFEDYGSGSLSSGVARVALEPNFAQTVNAGVEYHVFLTPAGDCEGLYVTNKTPHGFEVHELRGGHSSVGFDYKIVAKRKGHENIRLADKTEMLKGMKADAEEMKRKAELRGHPQPPQRPQPQAMAIAAPPRPPIQAVAHPLPLPPHAYPVQPAAPAVHK